MSSSCDLQFSNHCRLYDFHKVNAKITTQFAPSKEQDKAKQLATKPKRPEDYKLL